MKLYHFTDEDIGTLKIENFGKNHYSKNDLKYPQKRLFFYDSLEPGEYHLKGCQYRYTVNIDEKDIYNLDTDKLRLKQKYNYDIDNILKFIDENFKACCYTSSFLCYCVFKDIIPTKKENLK